MQILIQSLACPLVVICDLSSALELSVGLVISCSHCMIMAFPFIE